MTIRALSRQEFDRFGSAQWTLGGLTRRAVEWFADDTGDVFGVIAAHGSDLDWSYAVITREHAGKFRALALDFGFLDANDARRLLFEKWRWPWRPATTGFRLYRPAKANKPVRQIHVRRTAHNAPGFWNHAAGLLLEYHAALGVLALTPKSDGANVAR